MSQLSFIFYGGASKRFHTATTLRTQDIAAHSFGVAWMAELITEGKASKNLIMACLAHDLAEHLTGDIPSPAKRAMKIGELFASYEMKYLGQVGLDYETGLTLEERDVLKLADMLDGMLYCVRERQLGNTTIDAIYGRYSSYAIEVVKPLNKNFNLIPEINAMWEAAVNGRQ